MGQIFVKASRRAKAYTRTGPVTRSLRKEMKKGSTTGRLEKAFGKINKAISTRPSLKTRRRALINIDRKRYGLLAYNGW